MLSGHELMPEDSPVEGDEENSERIEDCRVNDEDDKRCGEPGPRCGGVQSCTEYHVADSEHTNQYQRQRQHQHSH